MSFPAILDVGLGLAVVFFLLASICSILVEIIANWRKWRHQTLRTTINALLVGHPVGKTKKDSTIRSQPSIPSSTSDSTALPTATSSSAGDQGIVNRFWSHPEIEPLRSADTASPGYMDAGRFATVVLDLATGEGAEGVLPNTRRALQHTFAKYASPPLLDRLNSLLRNLPANTPDVRASITAALAKWFDEAMARTSGGYKRKVQKWLFWIGLTAALILNGDTLRMSYVLFRDPSLSGSMVDYAKSISEQYASFTNQSSSAVSGNPAMGVTLTNSLREITPAIPPHESPLTDLRSALRIQIKELQKIERIGFPIGWVFPFRENFLPLNAEESPASGKWVLAAMFMKIIGLMATAFAVCLGAPFWFDVLNKLLKLRGATPSAAGASGVGGGAGQAMPSAASSPVVSQGGAFLSPAPSLTTSLPAIGEALREPGTKFNAAKTYWLAEASRLAYAASTVIDATVQGDWRFDSITHFNSPSPIKPGDLTTPHTQGFLAVGPGLAILAFRGTEPSQLQDWVTDASASLKSADNYPGRVHEGFAGALASVYASVQTAVSALPGSGALLYVTGHSLGAALATLCAQRLAAERRYPIQSVCTFGSPRVGDPDFANDFDRQLGARAYRLVNHEDLVTRVPPRAAGYKHVGQIVYIDETGQLQRDVGFWYRFLNLVANAAQDFSKAAKTTVRDHSMTLYCEHLKRAATLSHE